MLDVGRDRQEPCRVVLESDRSAAARSVRTRPWSGSASIRCRASSAKVGWARSTRPRSGSRSAAWRSRCCGRSCAKDEEGRRLFLNEMQILAQLEHPNVVRSLASLEVEGQLVIVLEYLEGKTLRGAPQRARALPWARGGATSPRRSQRRSPPRTGSEPPIVHRDLKPENVMVLRRRAAHREGDGLRHRQGPRARARQATQSVGTLQYMSPEQIDARAIDARSDLYALGLLLYEMLAGAPPFRSASPRELLNLQCTAEPPPFADEVEAPAGVSELVFELLEKAPDDRPQIGRGRARGARAVPRLARSARGFRASRRASGRAPSRSGPPSRRAR